MAQQNNTGQGKLPQFSHDLDNIYDLSDELGRDEMAREITEELRGPNTPNVIGVYGWWGSGKSYLLSQTIRRLLEANKAGELRTIVCVYSPWRYEMEGDLAPGLIRALMNVDQQFTERDPVNPTLDLDLSGKEGYKDIAKTLLDMIIEIGPSLVPGGGALAAVISQVLKMTVESVEDYGKKLAKAQKMPRIDEVRGHMQKLVNAILKAARAADSSKEYRLTVFIDDLDRCSPENMVRMFEWLKVHLSVENCAYVMALDHVAAARAIVGRYKEYLGEERDLAYGFRYLEKLVDSEYELGAAPKVELMALRQAYKQSDCQRLSEAAREICEGDFPGLGNMDELLSLRSLRTPRTMLKIAWKYRRTLDTILSERAASLRSQLAAAYPFWTLLMISMYYRLEPDDLAEFIRGRGNIYQLMSNPGSVNPSEWGTGPMREFCQYADRFGASVGTSMQLPTSEMLFQLASIIRENSYTPEP